jgi:hypothetical protein
LSENTFDPAHFVCNLAWRVCKKREEARLGCAFFFSIKSIRNFVTDFNLYIGMKI